MRGLDARAASRFSYADIEARAAADHPLRTIGRIVDDVPPRSMPISMPQFRGPNFEMVYAPRGRGSIPPERLLRGSPVQALFATRSERQSMQQRDDDPLFRRFAGLGVDDPVWDRSAYPKNRGRLA